MNHSHARRGHLSRATLNGMDLSGIKLNGVTTSGTVFDSSDLHGAQRAGLQFGAPASFHAITLGESNGVCTSFQNTNLRNVNITLREAAPAPGCETSPAFPNSTVPLSLVGYLHARDASGLVSLQKAKILASTGDRSTLAGQDLHGVNLSHAAFIGWPVDLSKTILDGSALDGAGFSHADLSNASFASADMGEASFDRALANSTNFTGARATKSGFNGAHIYGNGRAFDTATDMTEVNFTNALLAGTAQAGGFNLHSANLSSAIFDGSQCIGCNFTGSTLDGASFVGAYLPGGVLSNATLRQCARARLCAVLATRGRPGGPGGGRDDDPSWVQW